jgi:glutamate--cysteine ligase
VFLLHCLSQESPSDSPLEIAAMSRNQQCVAERGREPGLQLQRGETTVALKDWGLELVQQFAPIARALDAAHGTSDYSAAVDYAENALHHPETLPSARVLQEMHEEFGSSFAAFAKAHSLETKAQELARPLEAHALAHFEQLAEDSRLQQGAIEAGDSLPFAQYLAQYLMPERLGRSV